MSIRTLCWIAPWLAFGCTPDPYTGNRNGAAQMAIVGGAVTSSAALVSVTGNPNGGYRVQFTANSIQVMTATPPTTAAQQCALNANAADANGASIIPAGQTCGALTLDTGTMILYRDTTIALELHWHDAQMGREEETITAQ